LVFEERRQLTVETNNERYENLLATIGAITFQKLDERLLNLLLDKSIAKGKNETEAI
jgi:hypothetical protein